jgi:hypothetical protein
LPSYQRDYAGQGYPQQYQQQQSIRTNKYRYTPRDSNSQQAWQKRGRPDQSRSESQGRGREGDRRNDRDSNRENDNDRGNDRDREPGDGRR